MLDAYIIDAIKQEELERERQLEEGRRIWLEIPPPHAYDDRAPRPEEEAPQRGVLIIPLYPDDEEEEDAA